MNISIEITNDKKEVMYKLYARDSFETVKKFLDLVEKEASQK